MQGRSWLLRSAARACGVSRSPLPTPPPGDRFHWWDEWGSLKAGEVEDVASLMGEVGRSLVRKCRGMEQDSGKEVGVEELLRAKAR